MPGFRNLVSCVGFPFQETAMVRRARIEVEGGLCHVHNRVSSGESIFSDPKEAIGFIEIIREMKTPDGWAVLAWCVPSDHYHLVIRTATVHLWRWMHRVQNYGAGRKVRCNFLSFQSLEPIAIYLPILGVRLMHWPNCWRGSTGYINES